MSTTGPKAKTIYEMQVVRIKDHTPLVRELFVETRRPETFKFKAGQFAMLHVPTDDKPALRAYSIASDDRKENGFTLLFKAVEGGIGTKYVWNLKGGETLKFTGPFGRVLFQEPPTEQIIFLNTGSGIAQHASYLASFAEKYPKLSYRMLFGLRYEADIYYQDEIIELGRPFDDFKCDFVLSRPTEKWHGKKGYIQDHVNDFDYMARPTTFYLCGNGAMIKDVKRMLIEEKGFDKTKIWAEAFD